MQATFEQEHEPPKRLTDGEMLEVKASADVAAMTGELSLSRRIVGEAVIEDVVQTVQSFKIQQDLFSRDGMYPVLSVGRHALALDIAGSADIPLSNDISREQAIEIRRSATDNARNGGLNVIFYSVGQVRSFFARNLQELLKLRISAARGAFIGIPPSGTASVPGLNVRVVSKTHHIKILCTPSLFPNINSTFGNTLSSPVDGYLAPGIYIFGGMGPPLGGVKWEPTFETISQQTVVNTVTL